MPPDDLSGVHSSSIERHSDSVPLAFEALGYLGAIFVIIGLVTFLSLHWDRAHSWSRLVILAVTAIAFTAAGLGLRDESDQVLWRLREIVLLLGSGAVAAFTTVLAVDVLGAHARPATLLVGVVTTTHSGLLWKFQERPAQHLASLVGMIISVAGVISCLDGGIGLVGLGLWALGSTWLVASFRGVLSPAFLGIPLGAVLALVATAITSYRWNDFGVVLGLLTATAILVGGSKNNGLLITMIGVVGVFVYLPLSINDYFGGTIGVPAAVLLSGLALLGLTVHLVQQRSSP